MDKKVVLEGLYNFLDIGIAAEMVRNSIKMRLEMGVGEFFRHLMFGKGYASLAPIELEKMTGREKDLPIIDLREKKAFKDYHINGAILHPFDDFLKGILMDGQYREYQHRPMVLICDTGHKSRAAAAVLAEAGFKDVFSARRGMRRFRRWQHLKAILEQPKRRPCMICFELTGLGLRNPME